MVFTWHSAESVASVSDTCWRRGGCSIADEALARMAGNRSLGSRICPGCSGLFIQMKMNDRYWLGNGRWWDDGQGRLSTKSPHSFNHKESGTHQATSMSTPSCP